MDRFEMNEHDELIDLLHEEVSQGNYYEAKLIAEVISAKTTDRTRNRTLALA